MSDPSQSLMVREAYVRSQSEFEGERSICQILVGVWGREKHMSDPSQSLMVREVYVRPQSEFDGKRSIRQIPVRV